MLNIVQTLGTDNGAMATSRTVSKMGLGTSAAVGTCDQ